MKELEVVINLADVLFDVLNTTHRAGLALEAANGNNYRAAAHVMASLDAEDELQIARSMSSAANRIKTEFGEYLSEPEDKEKDGKTPSVSNKLDTEAMLGIYDAEESEATKKVLTYKFELPSNFNSSARDALAGGIHEYIVASTIADWYMTSNPGAVESYEGLMTVALENARRALYKRSRPKRPSYITNAKG